jgi:hypothetical protein
MYKLDKYKFKLAQLEKSGKKDAVKRNIYLMKLKKYSNVLVGGAQCHEGVSNCPCRGCTCAIQAPVHQITPGINIDGNAIHCAFKSCQCECMCSYAHINPGNNAPRRSEDVDFQLPAADFQPAAADWNKTLDASSWDENDYQYGMSN